MNTHCSGRRSSPIEATPNRGKLMKPGWQKAVFPLILLSFVCAHMIEAAQTKLQLQFV